MLCVDFLAFEAFGFQERDFEHFFGLFVERELANIEIPVALGAGRNGLFQGRSKRSGIDFQGVKYLDGQVVFFLQNAQEKVFRADVVVSQTNGLIPAPGDDLFDLG